MPNPTLVSIAVEEPRQYVAVNSTGGFWRGTLRQSAPTGLEFIAWTRLDSEFPRLRVSRVCGEERGSSSPRSGQTPHRPTAEKPRPPGRSRTAPRHMDYEPADLLTA